MLRIVARALFIIFCLFPVCVLSDSNDKSLNAADDRVVETPAVAAKRQDIENSKSIVNKIKQNKPFTNYENEKIWNFEETDEQDANPDLAWLGELFNFIAMLIEAILWLVPVVLVFYIYRYREYWLNFVKGNKKRNQQSKLPETLFGLDVRQENLPENILDSATLMWQKNKYRDAISLLYRAALISLFKEYSFDLSAGATEQDCIRKIEIYNRKSSKKLSKIKINYFKRLTTIWVSVAYAHRFPDDDLFKQLCADWNQFYSVNEVSD